MSKIHMDVNALTTINDLISKPSIIWALSKEVSLSDITDLFFNLC